MSDTTEPTEYMLTTVDNPFNPFTHFDEWYVWDTQAGYHTTSFLARLLITSDELSLGDQAQAIEMTIDEIVKENITGMYRKVSSKEVPG
jgi:hypothetical protein